MNTGRFFAPDIIITKVAELVDDAGYTYKSRNAYLSIVQKAVEELAIVAKYDEQWQSFDFPEDLRLDFPDNCFNIKNIYLFNGQSCNIQDSVKVYWKRNFYTEGKGYVANNKWNNRNDPFFRSHNVGIDNQSIQHNPHLRINPSGIYYYNIQNGQIMFSSSCSSAGKKVMLNYNGLGGEFGKEPFIPALYRTAIEDYVCEYVLRGKMAKDAVRWSKIWSVYENRLKNPMNGSWEEAIMRAKKMNSSQKNELNIYLGRGDWGQGR